VILGGSTGSTSPHGRLLEKATTPLRSRWGEETDHRGPEDKMGEVAAQREESGKTLASPDGAISLVRYR
jgi:hypothetical protein